MSPFTPLGDTLQNNSNGNDSPKDNSDIDKAVKAAVEVMGELFGEELSKDAKPLFLKNRTVTISCSSTAVAQEIRINQAEIVEKINNKLGTKEVDRIRYLA